MKSSIVIIDRVSKILPFPKMEYALWTSLSLSDAKSNFKYKSGFASNFYFEDSLDKCILSNNRKSIVLWNHCFDKMQLTYFKSYTWIFHFYLSLGTSHVPSIQDITGTPTYLVAMNPSNKS